MSLAPREDGVELTARELREIVEMRDFSDFERLTALREAYAQIVRDMGLELAAVDRRVDKERFGRGWDREER